MTDIATLGIAVDSTQVKDAKEELRGLGKQAGETEQSTNKLTEASDKLGSMLPTVSIAAGAATAAMITMVKSAIDAADAVGKLSQKVGISAEVISGYQHAAGLADVSTEQLATGLKMLAKNVVDNEKAFDEWGVKVRDSNGNLMSAERIFEAVADKMQGMEDGTQKTAMAIELLGKAGADMIPMLNEGSVGLELMRKQSQLTGTAISSEFAEQAQQFNDNLTEIGNQARAAANGIAAYLLPALNGLLEFFNEKPADRLAEIADEIAKLRGLDDYTGFADVQIAKLEAEEKKLREIVRLEQQRDALAIASGGDFRDARDRAGEAGSLEGKRLEFEEKNKPKDRSKQDAADAAKAEDDRIKERDASIMSQHELIMAGIAAEEEAQNRLFELRQSLFDEGFIRDSERYVEQSNMLQEALDNQYLTQAQFEEQRFMLTQQYLAKQGDASAKAAIKVANFEKATATQKTQFLLAEGMALTAGFATQSKTAFEINKKLSIGQAVMTTYDNAVKAFNAYASIPYVGPVLGAVAAAGAIAFGMAQVSQIKSQQFGGGGGGGGASVPSMPSYSPGQANAQMLEGSTAPIQAQPVSVVGTEERTKSQINVTLVGDTFDAKMVSEKLIPLINESVEFGANINVNRG